MTHRVYSCIIALIGVMLFISCSNVDNPDFIQENNRMPLIILDTDIGSSTDDLFAMEMLYRYEEHGHLTVTPECVTIFTVSVAGHFRYQMPGDAAWAAAMLEKIRMFNKKH